MKFHNTILLVLVTNLSFSQNTNLAVTYKSILKDDLNEYGSYMYNKGELITNSKESLYFETPLDTIFHMENFGTVSTSSNKYKFTYYKDLVKNVVIYDRSYSLKQIVADDQYKIDWTVTNNTKKILNHQCQEAIGRFRGRRYIAFFATEISIPNGPFKFDGLPGLILEVKSEDGAVSIIASEIKQNDTIIANPFTGKNYKSWSDFMTSYGKYLDRVSNKVLEENITMTVPNRYIEYFIKK
jgi:GLPGLI family protein